MPYEKDRDMLDVTQLVPEAQPIVRAAVEVYLKYLGQWCIGVVAHGSAFKGGYIPGCSDIDLQFYLDASAFTTKGHLPLDVCFALHRDLAEIELFPFQYVQGYALPPIARKGYVGLISGAYHMIWGTLPIAEATEEELEASARKALQNLDLPLAYIPEGLLQHGGGRLARQVRFLCTDVWPVLYQVLTIQRHDAIGMWRLPKLEAMKLLPAGSPLAQTLQAFYHAICRYYPTEMSVADALSAIENGMAFLQAAKSWWSESGMAEALIPCGF